MVFLMKTTVTTPATLLIALFLTTAHGFAAANQEIDFLLDYVGNSGCTFIRNGKEYDSLKAKEHLLKKYNYAKSRITNAEDFISHIASKSSISKRKYMVRCDSIEQPTGEWLAVVLARKRAGDGG